MVEKQKLSKEVKTHLLDLKYNLSILEDLHKKHKRDDSWSLRIQIDNREKVIEYIIQKLKDDCNYIVTEEDVQEMVNKL